MTDYIKREDVLRAMQQCIDALPDASPVSEERPCTCHPDDNPPVPCPKKYALAECRAAAEQARLLRAPQQQAEPVAEITDVQGSLNDICIVTWRKHQPIPPVGTLLYAAPPDSAARIAELEAKVQFLVDHWPTKLEDGGITFPDGESWPASRALEAKP
jgi:hypothetical protein